MAQNLFFEVYQYELRNYTESTYIVENEIATTSIEVSENDECGSIITNADNTNEKPIRSCDQIKGNIVYHIQSNLLADPPNLALNAFNPDNSYKFSFNINYMGNNITSDDLIRFSNLYGSKKFRKVQINTARIPSMALLYNRDTIIAINKSIQNILLNDRIDPRYLNAAGLITPLDFSGLNINDAATLAIISPYINNNSQNKNKIDNNSHSLIKKINADINDKFIILGDLHGSYSTFIRILLRLRKLNIMNKNCKLMHNYNIIFLGDIVDRGQYGFEIVMIIFLLKLINPNKIHINAGNHENINQNIDDGFKQDIDNKFIPAYRDIIFNTINETFNFLHSAIIIRNPNNHRYIYLAHGGLPTSYESFLQMRTARNIPIVQPAYGRIMSLTPRGIPYTADEKQILDTDILPDNLFPNFDNGNIIIKDTKIQQEIVHTIDSDSLFFTNTIRWNDFWGFNNSIKYLTDDGRGRSNKLGFNSIERAREKGIDLIIRGHQDSNFNFKLISRNPVNYIPQISDIDEANPAYGIFNINDIPAYGRPQGGAIEQVHCYGFTHLIGINDTHQMVINDTVKDRLFPVITLSTNTDLGRNLTYDSFGILKFRNLHQDNNCVTYGSAEEIAKKIKRIRDRYTIIKLQINFENLERQGLLIGEAEQLRAKYNLLAPAGTPELEVIEIPDREPEPMNINGGNYYKKYIKYKQKYLKLKSLI
jgi:hypothetical protein